MYAQTNREINAVIPAVYQEKEEITREGKKYALIIGKKRINFYKDSGILGDSCDKMYTSYVLTLPGGFQLPVTLVIETWKFWDTTKQQMEPEAAARQMQDCSMRYLQSVMVAGSVMKSSAQNQNSDDLFLLNSKYFCHEMIGQVRNEENIITYGK